MNFISGTILQFYHSQNFTTVKIIRNYVILCEFLRWLRSKDPLARPGAAGNAGSIMATAEECLLILRNPTAL